MPTEPRTIPVSLLCVGFTWRRATALAVGLVRPSRHPIPAVGELSPKAFWALGCPFAESLPCRGHMTTFDLRFPTLSPPCGERILCPWGGGMWRAPRGPHIQQAAQVDRPFPPPLPTICCCCLCWLAGWLAATLHTSLARTWARNPSLVQHALGPKVMCSPTTEGPSLLESI